MKNERWQRVERIYHSTLEKNVEERARFLDDACDGDEGLRREVESLLAYETEAKDFIEFPALEFAAKMMADDQSSMMPIGQMVGHYKIISRIGAGGMGEVYLAEDLRLRRKVALKFLPVLLTKDKTHLRRFKLEARAVAALSHPNVCTIHEITETDDGRHCIVMEYVDGSTLRAQMLQGRLTVNEALDLAIQIASALASAHAAGVVHRDIKPENVMLRRDGYVKVLDFGLAKLTEKDSEPDDETRPLELKTVPGMVMGTVAYMSPEQARGLQVDARTDIWSLGVVLYEMVAGRKPFGGPTATDVIISIAEREPEPLSKSAPEAISLQQILTKSLAKDRSGRYQTADDMLADLKSLKSNLDRGTEPDLHRHPVTSPASTSGLSKQGSTKNRVAILAAVLAILTIGILLSSVLFRRSSTNTPHADIKSIAVLPMRNLSADPSHDYFAEGMTETLIAGLAKLTSLRVTSRTSVMQFKDSKKSVKEIAAALGVDAVVEGSVQRSGEKIRVHVQLIHAATDDNLLSETYDRDLRDVLALQNEVANAVAKAIQIKVTPQEQSRLSQSRRLNPEAYDEFLRGRFYLNRQNQADNESAIQKLKRAVEIDPEFAAGWAELAQAYVWKLFLFAPDDKELPQQAFMAVEKARALDPNLPEVYLARGRLLWTPANHFPHEQAIQEYRKALALNPSLDEARNQLALVLSHVGLLDEALEESNKALAINPNNNLARFRVGEILLFQGKHEQALNALQNVPPAVNPALIGHQIVLAFFDLGRKEEAEAALEKSLRDYPDDNRGLFTSLQALLAASKGDQALAEEKIKLAIEKGQGFGHFHHTAYHIACTYAVMKKRRDAIKWLESAADNGFPCYEMFSTDRKLDNLRDDPAFITLMSKMKEQWEKYKRVLATN